MAEEANVGGAEESAAQYLREISDRLLGWFEVVEGRFPPGEPSLVLMLKTPKGQHMVCRVHTWREMDEKAKEYAHLIGLLQDSGAL